MKRSYRSILALAASLLVSIVYLSPAAAQATRTWVSGVGDDANPCSRTAPCKTFAGTMSKTAAGGIINCLDPGGFGAVTITKSITIDCHNVAAGILAAGTNGVNVVVGASDVVTLRGLSIEGTGTGLVGVNHTGSGTLHIENCRIFGFRSGSAIGIRFAPNNGGDLLVTDSYVNDNGTVSAGAGIQARPTGPLPVTVSLRNVKMHDNFNGFIADSSGGAGINAQIAESSANANGNVGLVALTTASSPIASLLVIRSSMTNNGNAGAMAIGTNAQVLLNDSSAAFNNVGVAAASGGRLFTYGTNTINSNATSDGTPIPNGLQRF